jgi:MOB kinase activator 1
LLGLFQAPVVTTSHSSSNDPPYAALLTAHPFGTMDNLFLVLTNAQQQNSTVKPRLPDALSARLAPLRMQIHQALNNALSFYGKNPNFQEAINRSLRVPPKVKKIEWILATSLEMYSLLILSFGMLTNRCTDGSCPTMAASEEIHYAWADGELIKTPITVSAQKYVSYLNDWIATKLEAASLFPPSPAEKLSTKNVTAFLKVMGKKLLRIFAHIYFCHWSFILSIDYANILTTVFVISYHTCVSFKLIDLKADATTIDPCNLLRRQLGMSGAT